MNMRQLLRRSAGILGLVGLLGGGAALAAGAWYTINTAFGTSGVAQLLAATSYHVADAVDRNDSAGHIYSLVSAQNTNHNSNYAGPYTIVRRTAGGSIDTGFASNGVIATFANSNAASNPEVDLRALCIDPSTHDIVVAGRIIRTVSFGFVEEMLVERLIPPASSSSSAFLDTSFNVSGTGSGTAGVVVVPTQYQSDVHRCVVGGDGTVYLAGPDAPGSGAFGKLGIAKIRKDGTPANFGANGLAEFFLPGPGAAFSPPQVSDLTDYNPNATGNNDLLLSGDADDISSTRQSMAALLDRCSGALDPKFNGNGVLLNTTLNGTLYNTIFSGKILDSGGVGLTFVAGGSGITSPAVNLAVFPYPLAAGGAPSSTEPGTASPPSGYKFHNGGSFDAAGNLIIGLNGTTNQETVTELTGQSNLGFTVGDPATAACAGTPSPPLFTRLYTFSAANATTHVNSDGIGPSRLIQGIDGNFYGTAGGGIGVDAHNVEISGGANDTGTVFKVSPSGVYTVLHTFSALGTQTNFNNISGPNADGAYPGFPLAQGPDGTLYGVTTAGGANGNGAIFKLAPDGSGFSTLYSFSAADSNGNNADGCFPFKGLILGADGNLYGTAHYCGPRNGTMFRITPAGVFTVLVDFGGASGANAQTLFQDNDGTIYGEAGAGGTYGNGGIFLYFPSGGGYTVLYNFGPTDSLGRNSDGARPIGGLSKGPDGQLYGVTNVGGANGSGTIFKFSPSGGLTTLYSFSAPLSNGTNPDGAGPVGDFVMAGDGNLYGAIGNGGSGANNSGDLFRVTPTGTFTTLYSFSATNASGANSDGAVSIRGLTLGRDGNLYGGATFGGSNGNGTIFKLSPGSLPPVPAVAIAANPTTITVGMSTLLQWATRGAASCTASGGWSGSVATSGTQSVKPAATGTVNYNLLCSNSTGSSNNSTAVSVIAQPLAPPNLSATAGNGQVTLNWGASFGATSYKVYQGTTAGGEGATAVKAGITGTSTVIGGLSNGTTYYFKVTAVNASGESGKSNEASARPVAPPAAPTGVTATPGNGQVTVGWIASSGATSYNIYQGTTAGGEGATPVRTGVTATSMAITGLSNGTTYYFKVAAVDAGGTSPLSAEASAKPVAPPAAPTGVSATPGNAQVTLAWTASSGATSYNIYQGTTAGGESSIPVETGVTATSAIITGLANGTTYYFKVAAVNAGGTSPLSAEASARPALTIPAAPTGLAAAAGNAQVSLHWTAPAGNEAASYNVYQGTAAGGESSIPVKTGITATSVMITGLSNGTTYYFKVAAVNSLGTGPLSAEASARPLAPPAAPTGFTAAAGNAQVTLHWTASTNAASYNVYQGTTAGGESSIPVKTGITGTSVAITGLSNGTTYYFKVAAVDASGTGPLSTEASARPVAPPAAPTGLTATTAAGSSQVSLKWTAAVNAVSYNVYQGTTAGGEASTPVRTGITGTSVGITGLSNGIKYYFKVAGVDAGGVGAQSNEASATP
jgi:uncharacterized repeat protein (TIGR03803 family)